MRVAIPVHDGRVSPVFDAARHLLVIRTRDREVVARKELDVEDPGPYSRAHLVVGLGINVLICGAISRQIEAMLASEGVTVIARRCGEVEEIVRAFLAGGLGQGAFLMPGVRGNRGG